MATGTGLWYTKAQRQLADKQVDWLGANQTTGTASGGSGTTLVDTGAGWGVNAYQGNYVIITGGTGSGQAAYIASNTSDTLTVTATGQWTTSPDGTSTYKIIDFPVKVLLVKAAYTPNQDTHDFLNDVLANEITDVGGTAYNARNGDSTGGYILANTTIDDTTTSKTIIYDADDLSLTASGGNIGDGSTGDVKYYVFFYETGTADGSDCPLLGYATVDTAQQATDGNSFTIAWGANGVLKATVS